MEKKAKAGVSEEAAKPMGIEQLRESIDIVDRQIVDLIGKRAAAAHEIGRIKKNQGLPIYEPAREKAVLTNVENANQGILSDRDMISIFERIMDMMRKIQQEEIAPETAE